MFRSKEEVERWPRILNLTECQRDSVCCLRNLTSTQLTSAMDRIREFYPMDTWAPMVDGVLVTVDPMDALQEAHFVHRKLDQLEVRHHQLIVLVRHFSFFFFSFSFSFTTDITCRFSGPLLSGITANEGSHLAVAIADEKGISIELNNVSTKLRHHNDSRLIYSVRQNN